MSDYIFSRLIIRGLLGPLFNLIFKTLKISISYLPEHFTKKQIKKLIKVSNIDGKYNLFFINDSAAMDVAYSKHGLDEYIYAAAKQGRYFTIRMPRDRTAIPVIFIFAYNINPHDLNQYKINVIKSIFNGYGLLQQVSTRITLLNNLPYEECQMYGDNLYHELRKNGKLKFVLPNDISNMVEV